MSEEPSAYIQMVQRCEAAIVRIRASIRAGAPDAEQVGADFSLILSACAPRLAGFARRAVGLGPLAFEEALDAMHDRLLDDIWSLGYASMETQFGAYLNSMPLRALWKIARKYGAAGASLPVERLDAAPGGADPHESLADPAAEAAFDAVGERAALDAALAALPPAERMVVGLRRAGVDNNAIARRMGVSPATATRIYQRALAQLRRLMAGEE